MASTDCPPRFLEYQPDPDIAGIGIVLGFLGTAWLVILILIIYYLFYYDPTIDPFGSGPTDKLHRPNPFDMVFYNAKRRVFNQLHKRVGNGPLGRVSKRLQTRAGSEAFQETIMALSDAQIVTGIAIMISGFYAATQDLSGYHWKMVTRVAWFSTITHLAALSCLRTYLHENKVKRTLRLILMGALSVMLIAAMMTQADSHYHDDASVACFLQVPRPHFNTADQDIVFAVLLLLYNIILRALKLHRTTSRAGSRRFRRAVAHIAKLVAELLMAGLQKIPTQRLRLLAYMVIVQPYVASLILLETYYHMYTSAVAEVYWLLVMAFYGTLRLVSLRNAKSQEENTWTFGQVIACAMFLAPLLVFLDTAAKTINSGDSSSDNSSIISAPASSGGQGQRSEDDNRYARWAQEPEARATRYPDEAIDQLRRLDWSSYSSLSIGPLITFDSHGVSRRPFLHHFEDLSWFDYLVVQLCGSALCTTFWVVFADLELFWPIGDSLAETFPLHVWEDSDDIWEIYSEHSPATNMLILVFWICFLGPSSSVFFLLCWRWSPLRLYRPPGFWRPVLRLAFALSFYCLPVFTFFYLEVQDAAIVWSCVLAAYVLGCVGLSMQNAIPDQGVPPAV